MNELIRCYPGSRSAGGRDNKGLVGYGGGVGGTEIDDAIQQRDRDKDGVRVLGQATHHCPFQAKFMCL